MRIEPFAVEQWMNSHETTARWNIAETCVDSLRLGELLELTGDADAELRRLRDTQLTYGHITGSPALRAAIAVLYGERIGAGNVLTANGAIGANFLVHACLVQPGDTVICVQPTYQQLYSVPEALSARVKPLPLREANGYLPDVDELRGLVDARTRLIVLNNPNNPCGSLMDEALLRDIVAVAEECGAWLHADEVYRYLEHEPGATAPSVVDLCDKAVSTGSMSKTWSLAGLRTGWIAGPEELIARCEQMRDYTTISCGVLDDALSVLALEHKGALLARNLELLRGNLAIVEHWLAGEARLRSVRPRAGTTILVRYDHAMPSIRLCEELFAFNGAFVVPGAAFGEEHCFRLSYACPHGVLTGGLAAVSEYLRTLES